jgi:protein TonB
MSKPIAQPYVASRMIDAETKPRRSGRVGAAIAVAVLHLAAIAVLIRAFAPDLGAVVLGPVTQAFDIAVPPPQPRPSPESRVSIEPRQQGRTGSAGRKATSRAVSAPPVTQKLSLAVAPLVPATGADISAGALSGGQGSGAGSAGDGLGAGGQGEGGGGGAARPTKIAGDIVSARDYPAETRDLRLGSAVTVAVAVDASGRASGCRIVRASRDPDADRITCALAIQRFRFRPARNAQGQPIPGVYGWQQRWFAPPK